VKKSWR